MSWKIKLLLYLSLFVTGHITAMCQISGIVNTYTKVTAVNYVCNFITVSSPTGFAAGDKVLLIQMQGAVIDQTNTTSFGNITDIADAGNYEFAIIDHFSTNDVYFTKTLLKTYTPAGAVQMVNVPQYAVISIDAELTPKPWDGNTGGVIVFESSDAVTLNANINANETGFRGGSKSPNGGDCSTFGLANYYYTFPSVQTGRKGEGIAAYITGKDGGRSKQATGGGGGGSHNTGGGGGGNYGAGGRGGDQKCGLDPYGFASLGLSTTFYNTTNNKIFMGGGGGGGHVNNNQSYDGGNGGGIVIIKAAAINSNGFVIKSNGGSVSTNYTSVFGDNGDGNSGGGAGGTVLLDVMSYTTTTSVEVSGGKGGNTGYTTYNFGPGGGGGGGVVWQSIASGILLNATLTGGSAGISGSGGGNGSGTKWGATDGSSGAVLNTLSIPQSSSSSSCALPVELLSFSAKALGKYQVQLNWSTATEVNNDFFSVERSVDGIHFYPLTKISGYANSHTATSYNYSDEVSVYDILYYRLKQTDIDGHTADLGIRKVYPSFSSSLDLTAYPNPCKDNLYLQFDKGKQESIKTITLVSAYGEPMNASWKETENGVSINTSSIPTGLYSLMLYSSIDTYTLKVIKEQ